MEIINIVFSIDHNYVRHCASTILSIIKHYEGELPVRIIITHDDNDFSIEDEKDMRAIVTDKRFCIDFLSIDKAPFKDMPIGGNTISTAITISAYYRVAYAKILPEHIHKIIYLDSDIYVNTSIDKLWATDMEGYAIAGVPEPARTNEEKCLRLNIPSHYKYVNSGVSIMNLDVMRAIDYPTLALQYAKDNHDRILYHDQDIANALLYDKTRYLPLRWNMVDTFLYKNPPLEDEALDEALDFQEHPYIIHYAGFIKPWHKECQNPHRNLYWEALEGTKWRDFQKTFRQPTFFKEVKLLIRLLLKGNPYFRK